jgi:hypothetical protein
MLCPLIKRHVVNPIGEYRVQDVKDPSHQYGVDDDKDKYKR